MAILCPKELMQLIPIVRVEGKCFQIEVSYLLLQKTEQSTSSVTETSFGPDVATAPVHRQSFNSCFDLNSFLIN